jgi:hypothetical protein
MISMDNKPVQFERARTAFHIRFQRRGAVSRVSLTGYSFSVGSAFEKSFAVVGIARYKALPIAFFAMLPGLSIAIAAMSPRLLASSLSGFIALIWTVAGVLSFLIGQLIQAVAVYATIQAVRGRMP